MLLRRFATCLFNARHYNVRHCCKLSNRPAISFLSGKFYSTDASDSSFITNSQLYQQIFDEDDDESNESKDDYLSIREQYIDQGSLQYERPFWRTFTSSFSILSFSPSLSRLLVVGNNLSGREIACLTAALGPQPA